MNSNDMIIVLVFINIVNKILPCFYRNINICTTNTYQSVSFLNSQGWESLEIAEYSIIGKDTLSFCFRSSPKVLHQTPGMDVTFQKA